MAVETSSELLSIRILLVQHSQQPWPISRRWYGMEVICLPCSKTLSRGLSGEPENSLQNSLISGKPVMYKTRDRISLQVSSLMTRCADQSNLQCYMKKLRHETWIGVCVRYSSPGAYHALTTLHYNCSTWSYSSDKWGQVLVLEKTAHYLNRQVLTRASSLRAEWSEKCIEGQYC